VADEVPTIDILAGESAADAPHWLKPPPKPDDDEGSKTEPPLKVGGVTVHVHREE
jgi:hypothetical protein